MSSYLNQVILIGRIGKTPEIAKTNDDKKIAKFSIATSEFWKDKETMERKEKTEWHRVVVYSSKLAEIIEQYAFAGALVCIEGKIKYEKWVNAQGQEQKTTMIVVDLNGKFMLLDQRKSGGSAEGHTESVDASHDTSHDDDIPF